MASLDDSQISHRSGSQLGKKKKKKGKKKKMPSVAVEEIKEVIQETMAVETKVEEIKEVAKIETPIIPEAPKEEEEVKKIETPRQDIPKPKELTNLEIQEIMTSKKKAAPLGKLTKENLDQQFRDQRSTPKFDENDIETESIMMLDQSMAGSKMNSPRRI